jgi:hypothetical protein
MHTLDQKGGILLIGFILVCQLGIAINAFGATCTFTGNGDGTSWSDNANWSCGSAPDPQNDHVVIPVGFNVVNDEPNDFVFENGMDLTIHGSLDMNNKKIEMKGDVCFLHVSSTGSLFDVVELFFNSGGEGLFDAGCDIEVNHLKVFDDSEIIVNTASFIVFQKLEILNTAGISGVGCIDYRGTNNDFQNDDGSQGIFGCLSTTFTGCNPQGTVLCGAPLTLIWTGNTDTRWHLGSNWSLNRVPTADELALIPDVSGASGNFPVVSTHVTIHTVTVESGAFVTLATDYGMTVKDAVNNSGTFTLKSDAYFDDFSYNAEFIGNMTVERTVLGGLSGNNQHFISSAVSNPNVTQLGDDLSGPWGSGLPGTNGVPVSPNTPCNPNELYSGSNYGNLFELDESLMTDDCGQSGWVVRSSGILENGRSYSAYLPAGSTAEMNGTPNTGNISLAGLTNSIGSNTLYKGWNLVGNPYPSPINTQDFLSANGAFTSPTRYIPSGPYAGTFQAYANGDNIAVGQGFYIKGSGAATFQDNMRNTGAANWSRSENWFAHKLDVVVTGNDFMDATYIYFNDQASENFDQVYDREKRKSRSGQPTLYTNNAEEKFSYNARSTESLNAIVPMGLNPGADGQFTLTFSGLESFNPTTSIYLEDKLAGEMTLLSNDASYQFDMLAEDNFDRFNIHFYDALTTDTEDLELGGLEIYTLNNLIYVDLRSIQAGLRSNIYVYNLEGQILAEARNAGQQVVELGLRNAGMGCYVVQVVNAMGQKSRKIILTH